MNITRYDPLQMLNQLQREMNSLFDRRFSNEDGRFLVVADIPGVDPKDIEVKMDNGMLTIKGERHSDLEEEKEGYKRVERSFGTFYRRFNLPETADAEGITAMSHNGSLEVVISKREALTQARRINISH